MTLDEVPSAVVDLNADRSRKFVVATIVGENGATKTVVRAGSYYAHSDGYRALKRELQSLEILEKLGGGSFQISREKEIRIFDESHEFGQESDRQLTARLIQEAYPDYKVEVLG